VVRLANLRGGVLKPTLQVYDGVIGRSGHSGFFAGDVFGSYARCRAGGIVAADGGDAAQLVSGDLFGLSQDAAWAGILPRWDAKSSSFFPHREDFGRMMARRLRWDITRDIGKWDLLMQAAAKEFKARGCIPFAGFCTDPCDGRTQGTKGMMDSLAYRNDAAIILRRLIRSLPRRSGVMGIATCDKGLPAMMMALAGSRELPVILVPGGVTLPPEEGEDAAKIQTMAFDFAWENQSSGGGGDGLSGVRNAGGGVSSWEQPLRRRSLARRLACRSLTPHSHLQGSRYGSILQHARPAHLNIWKKAESPHVKF